VPLKKPSDFFNNNPDDKGIDIGNIEVSEENFDDVFGVFNKYRSYLNEFESKLNNITEITEQIESLKSEIETSVKKEDLDKATLSHFLYFKESVAKIQDNVKSINEDKLTEIRENATSLLERVNKFVDYDIPNYKKNLVDFELRIENKISSDIDDALVDPIKEIEKSFEIKDKEFQRVKSELFSSIKDIEESVNENSKSNSKSIKKSVLDAKKRFEKIEENINTLSNNIVEENEVNLKAFEEVKSDIESLTKFLNESKTSDEKQNEKIDYIENYLRKSALGSFKKNLFKKVNSIHSEVSTNETRIKNQNESIDKLKKELSEQIKQLRVSVVLNESSNQKLDKKIDELEKDILSWDYDKKIGDLRSLFEIIKDEKYSEKINEIENLFIEIKEKGLNEKVEKLQQIIEQSDLNQRLDELEKRYKTTLSEETTDSNNVVNKKFVTFDQLQEHYRNFVNKVQLQLSTLGGGGETRLEFLDDVDRDTAKVDGKFLKYDSSVGKWVGASAASGSQTLDDVLGVGNTSSLGISVGVVTATSFEGDGSGLTGIVTGIQAGDNIEILESPSGNFIITSTSTSTSTWAVTSAGIHTTKNVGIGTTARVDEALFVEGDVRITGVLTVGQSSVTIDGNSDELKVGSGVTIDNSGTIRATSFEGIGSNLVGIITQIFVQNLEIEQTGGIATITGISTATISSDGIAVTGVSTLGIVTATQVFATGVITATSFEGDGSGLTGIITSVTGDSNIIVTETGGSVSIAQNGDLSVDSLNVSGNVTIGGTLTYEDVTNIDSIGLITARSGINATGVVTATSFEGDGSSLTGIVTAIQAGNNIEILESPSGNFIITSTSVEGIDINLGTPTDSNLVTPGALNTFTSSTKVTNSIDDLNELVFNVIRNTAVTEVDFVGFPLAGGSPLGVALTITHSGNANRFDVDWGDGTIDTNQTLANLSHTYNQPSGGTNTVVVTARNNSGVGAGHSFQTTKTGYVVVYTPDPGIGFSMFSAVSGGSSITFWDSGSTVYLENSTTNVTGFAVTFALDWGDGTDDFISANTEPGGVGGGRTVHTYTNAAETDSEYTVDLELSSHPAANPSVIPVSGTQTFRVYATHTPSFTTSDVIGINSSSNSGFPVVFSNTTEDTIGDFSTFGNTYRWTWGDGTTNNVNVGSAAAGDNDVDISHTFALTSSEQEVGTSKTFAVNLRAITNHTSSPFITANTIITVEPEVRSIFTGVATVISDRTGDNAQDLYDGVDLFGRNRRVGIFTNTSHNGEDYVYAWGDGSSNDTIPDNVSAGGTTTPIYHTFQGSTGNKTVTLTANGTPGTLVQNGKTSTVTMQLNAIPSAPTALSSVNLSMNSTSQGTNPRLCANATRNQSGAGIATGTSVIRYVTTTPVITNLLSDINGSHTGILTALYNGSADGQKSFTTSTGESGTFTSLNITSEGDAHDEISSSTYPTGFFQCFTARVSKALSGIDTGLNDFGMTHSTGSCGLVTFVRDNLNSTPTVTSGTLSESTGGTKRYISGIPYYNTGSPTLSLSGVEVTNFTGQTYQNTTSPVEIDPGTNQESTSGNVIGFNDYTYSQVDGSTTFIDLTYNVPIANTGVGAAYTFGSLSIPITTSSVRSVQTIKVRAKNSSGTGSYSTNSTNVQVHTASQSGINETAIAVADALGSTYDDDGVRVFDFSSDTTDTPSFTGSTNFYTNSVYSESSDPGVSGTKEATVRLGVLKHDVTDYSSGYLPVGPDRSGDTGTQYFTFAFRRQVVSNFDINITSSGISGLWIAAPGTDIDTTSGLNGWLRADTTYAGAGIPGSGSGGNGSDGCAFSNGDRIASSTSLSGGYTMTLGSENMSNATGNVVLIRIGLTSGQSITSLSIGQAVT